MNLVYLIVRDRPLFFKGGGGFGQFPKKKKHIPARQILLEKNRVWGASAVC